MLSIFVARERLWATRRFSLTNYFHLAYARLSYDYSAFDILIKFSECLVFATFACTSVSAFDSDEQTTVSNAKVLTFFVCFFIFLDTPFFRPAFVFASIPPSWPLHSLWLLKVSHSVKA